MQYTRTYLHTGTRVPRHTQRARTHTHTHTPEYTHTHTPPPPPPPPPPHTDTQNSHTLTHANNVHSNKKHASFLVYKHHILRKK